LCEIFGSLAQSHGYTLSKGARARLILHMHRRYAQRTEAFGNAREVRNQFQAATNRQELRLAAKTTALSPQELSEIAEEDILPVGEAAGALPLRWQMACPHCQAVNDWTAELLGENIACGKCGQSFMFDWPAPAVG